MKPGSCPAFCFLFGCFEGGADLVPKRILTHGLNHGFMRFALARGKARRQRLRPWLYLDLDLPVLTPLLGFTRGYLQAECSLLATNELDIDFGQELGVEQSAVLRAS
jgi:hypothetical protein